MISLIWAALASPVPCAVSPKGGHPGAADVCRNYHSQSCRACCAYLLYPFRALLAHKGITQSKAAAFRRVDVIRQPSLRFLASGDIGGKGGA